MQVINLFLAPEPKEEKAPAVTRSGRVSKRVSNFEIPITPADKRQSEKTEYKFDGPGVTLNSIPCAQYWINKCDSEDLKTLFKVCFNRMGRNSEVKQQLRKFNGFTYPEDSKDYQSRVNLIERFVSSKILYRVVINYTRTKFKAISVKVCLSFLNAKFSLGHFNFLARIFWKFLYSLDLS